MNLALNLFFMHRLRSFSIINTSMKLKSIYSRVNININMTPSYIKTLQSHNYLALGGIATLGLSDNTMKLLSITLTDNELYIAFHDIMSGCYEIPLEVTIILIGGVILMSSTAEQDIS